MLISFCSLAYPRNLPPEEPEKISYTIHHPIYHGQTAKIEIAVEDEAEFEKDWQPNEESEIKGEIRYFFEDHEETKEIQNLKLERPGGFIQFTYIGAYYVIPSINADDPHDLDCTEEEPCPFYPIFEN